MSERYDPKCGSCVQTKPGLEFRSVAQVLNKILDRLDALESREKERRNGWSESAGDIGGECIHGTKSDVICEPCRLRRESREQERVIEARPRFYTTREREPGLTTFVCNFCHEDFMSTQEYITDCDMHQMYEHTDECRRKHQAKPAPTTIKWVVWEYDTKNKKYYWDGTESFTRTKVGEIVAVQWAKGMKLTDVVDLPFNYITSRGGVIPVPGNVGDWVVQFAPDVFKVVPDDLFRALSALLDKICERVKP